MLVIGGKLDGRDIERPKGGRLRIPILSRPSPAPTPIDMATCGPEPNFEQDEYIVRSARLRKTGEEFNFLVLSSTPDEEFLAELNKRFAPEGDRGR